MGQTGIIYGTAGTVDFKFAVSGEVKRNSYVQTEHPEGKVLSLVTDVHRYSDITFDDAKKISSGIPVRKESKLSATASVIGYRDERNALQTPRTPFKPGEPVYTADENLIKDILGLMNEGLYLGLLRWHDIPVCLDPKSIAERHISVLAKTGSGKSYLVGVLIEELIKHKVPVVVIDPHDEYSSLVHPNLREEEIKLMKRFGIKPKGYAENVAVYSPDPKLNKNSIQLSFNDANMDAWQITELTSIKSPVHIGILRRVINELRAGKKYYTLRDIRNAAEDDPNTSKWGVVNKLDFLLSTNLFSGPGMDIGDFVKPGQATIINLRGVPPETQEVAVTMIARSLFNLRKLKKIPKVVLVVEEAHNFCPQEGSAGPSSILKTIASEGRKFGLGLGVVSQRPATVDKNVLSQCGVQIILKVTNPNDLKAITASFEGLTSSASDEIQRLPIGVAMVVGGNISMPVLVNVRVRETKHGGEEILEMDEIAEKEEGEKEPEEEKKQLEKVEEKPPKEEKKKKGFFARYFEEKTD
ncbi:MAG: DUF87 domain-containing protein [Thermoplasmatales archaeon]|nr:DUF87 domain-containing protein [Thermoplasmatales archaeon]